MGLLLAAITSNAQIERVQQRTGNLVKIEAMKFSSKFVVYVKEQIGDSCVIRVTYWDSHCMRCTVDKVSPPTEWYILEGKRGKVFLRPKE